LELVKRQLDACAARGGALSVPSRYILEISVESVAAAVAAERGGADRIELCSGARVGGTTPSAKLMRAVRECVTIPIYAMNRPRAGDFFYSEAEFEAMRRDVDIAKQAGMDGIVLGMLKADQKVDIERSRDLIERAKPLPVTFHRAFDECEDLFGALEDVIESGATRLLTSGGKPTAPEAWAVLGDLVKAAGERLIVLPGSGLQADNIWEAVKKTRAREYHAGLSSVVARPAEDLEKFEEEVWKMAGVLADWE
jgi:copper homeostasis protein